jgi:segregation and condensation protein B
MRIVTTPMCEEVVKLAGIRDYKVNKNPDLEEGDLAILLSESKVKMDSLAIKLNTPKQLFESIREVSKRTDHELSEGEILEFYEGYDLCIKYLKDYENSHVKVKVLSKFLTDIVDNIGFEINDENYDYVIYPDYLKDNVQNEDVIPVEIPSHNFVSKNPFERIQARYAILEKLI